MIKCKMVSREPGGGGAAPDVALADEDTGVVDGFGQAQLEDQGLQAALQEVLGRQRERVIQLVLALIQQAVLVHAAQQGFALKQPLGVRLVHREQRPRRLQAG